MAKRLPRKIFRWTREGDPAHYHGEWFRALDARRCGGDLSCKNNAKSIPQGTPYAQLDVPGTARVVGSAQVVVHSKRSFCPSCVAKIAPHAVCPLAEKKALTKDQKEMGARLYAAVLLWQDDSMIKALFETEANGLAESLFDRYGADPRKLITPEAVEKFIRQPRLKRRRL